MKRFGLLVAALFAFVALSAVGSNTATGSSRPLGHLVGDFTARSVFHGDPARPEPPFIGIEKITINAFDRTLELPEDPRTPTEDRGRFTVTRNGTTSTLPVLNISISDDGHSANVYAGTSTTDQLFYVFHDGGVPGNQIVGPPDPFEAGVSPTRDWYGFMSKFNGIFSVRGQLISGNLRVSTGGD
jgi:hypothetical protein